MSLESRKALAKMTLKIASHISVLNIKVKHTEGRYIQLVKEIGVLEDRVREVEKDLGSIVFKAVRNTLLAIGAMISAAYGLVMIFKNLVG